jgi:hypothetical protein
MRGGELRRTGALVAGAILAAGSLGACGDDDAKSSSNQAASDKQSSPRTAVVRFITADFRADDRNRDGILDEQEADAAITDDFEATDVNRDGALTIADVQKGLDEAKGGKARGPLSSYFSYPGAEDGRITEEEYAKGVSAQITEVMDKNSDGKVTLQEAIAFHRSPPDDRGGK